METAAAGRCTQSRHQHPRGGGRAAMISHQDPKTPRGVVILWVLGSWREKMLTAAAASPADAFRLVPRRPSGYSSGIMSVLPHLFRSASFRPPDCMTSPLVSFFLVLITSLCTSCQTCSHSDACIRRGEEGEYLRPTEISFDMVDGDWIFRVQGQVMSAASIDGLLGEHAAKHGFRPDKIFFFGAGMTDPLRTLPGSSFLGDVGVNDLGMLVINGRFESTNLKNVLPYMAQAELLRDANSSTIFAVLARFLPKSQ